MWSILCIYFVWRGWSTSFTKLAQRSNSSSSSTSLPGLFSMRVLPPQADPDVACRAHRLRLWPAGCGEVHPEQYLSSPKRVGIAHVFTAVQYSGTDYSENRHDRPTSGSGGLRLVQVLMPPIWQGTALQGPLLLRHPGDGGLLC